MLTVDHRLLGVEAGHQVLDVGCGSGRHSWGIYKQVDCSVYCLDIGEEDLKKTMYALFLIDEEDGRSGRWSAIRGDAMNLPLKDASFDRVVCSEVLEHLVDDSEGIKELVRVLKADGMLAVSVPTYLTETVYWRVSKDYNGNPGGHVRKYRAGRLIELLYQSDLRICAIRRKHALHSIYWLLRCLFGINNEKALIPSLYHRFLVWDLNTKSRPVRLLDDICNHIFPKSIVIYARKGEDGGHTSPHS